MRLALIVPGGVDRSGRERVIPVLLWLIERLASRHEVTVFSLGQEEKPAEWPLLGARVVDLGHPRRLPFPGGGIMLRIAQLRRAIGQAQFDVAHAFWAESGFLARIAFSRKIPIVVSLMGGEFAAIPAIGYGCGLYRRERMKVAFALRRAAVVTAPSRPMIEAAARHGIAARCIPLGVEQAGFLPPLPREPTDHIRLLHIASLNRVKDQPTLLRAFAAARLRFPRMILDVIGVDTLGGEVQALAAKLGLSDSVVFHGWLPTDQVRPFIQRSDLFVISSLHEGAPVAMVEAAACGVPTVGTAVGHIAEGSPERALAVPTGDAEGLADAIMAMATDSARRLRMGESARAWAAENDADSTAARYEEIYRGPHATDFLPHDRLR